MIIIMIVIMIVIVIMIIKIDNYTFRIPYIQRMPQSIISDISQDTYNLNDYYDDDYVPEYDECDYAYTYDYAYSYSYTYNYTYTYEN